VSLFGPAEIAGVGNTICFISSMLLIYDIKIQLVVFEVDLDSLKRSSAVFPALEKLGNRPLAIE
jgi:hypothetical protein